MDIYSIFIIGHIAGAFIGAGAAYTSDATFLRSVQDGRIDETEFRRLKRLSRFVWTGLIVLICSGLAIFLSNVEYYTQSDKFLAKMTIVLALTLNGIIFHVRHLPFIKQRLGRPLFQGANTEGALLMLSGVISAVSWTGALALGIMNSVPLPYQHIMAIYVGMLCIAALFSTFMMRKLLEKNSISIIQRSALVLAVVAIILGII